DAGPEDEEFAVRPAQYVTRDGDNPADIVESNINSERERAQLREAFVRLDDRAQEIVRRRWLTDDKSTLHELAAEFSISAERVRQLEQNALKKLRKEIAA
ncbi:MAG: RNA polymerase sigma-32 factor, partial [Candidatus Azotimanducaceae bacterium]